METNYEQKKKLDINVIKKVCSFFKELRKNNAIIFLHGSYAKGLNRWNSDIDLNILYQDESTYEQSILEELVNVLLYYIFDYSGCDKIHTMMLYTKNLQKMPIEIVNNNYSIKFPDEKLLCYKCRDNYEKIFPNLINSSRKIKSFENYLRINSTTKTCLEWCSSFLVLDSKTTIYNIINANDLQISNSRKFKSDLVDLINREIKSIKNDNNFLNFEIKFISEINTEIKIKNINKKRNSTI